MTLQSYFHRDSTLLMSSLLLVLFSTCAQAFLGARQEDVSFALCQDPGAEPPKGMSVASNTWYADALERQRLKLSSGADSDTHLNHDSQELQAVAKEASEEWRQLGEQPGNKIPVPPPLPNWRRMPLSNASRVAAFRTHIPTQVRKQAQRLLADAKFKMAEQAKTELDTFALALNHAYGFKFLKAPVKHLERASVKVKGDYEGDWLRIKDLARVTIIVPNPDDIILAMHEISTIFTPRNGYQGRPCHKIVIAEDDACGSPRNIFLVHAKNGIYGEIQINTNNLMYAKFSKETVQPVLGEKIYNDIKSTHCGLEGGKGHLLYEIWRNPSTEKELKKKVVAVSKLYYSYLLGGEANCTGSTAKEEIEEHLRGLQEDLTRVVKDDANKQEIEAKELTKELQQEIKDTFKNWNIDRSGWMDLTELEFAMNNLGFDFSKQDLQKMFSDVETDRSGTIDEAGFLSIYKSSLAGAAGQGAVSRAASQLIKTEAKKAVSQHDEAEQAPAEHQAGPQKAEYEAMEIKAMVNDRMKVDEAVDVNVLEKEVVEKEVEGMFNDFKEKVSKTVKDEFNALDKKSNEDTDENVKVMKIKEALKVKHGVRECT